MRDESFREFVLERLSGVEELACRRMFGGHGLYSGKIFFGIIHNGRLYFKVNDANLPDYRKRGMECFQPNEKQKLTSYYEVPVDVLESDSELREWSDRAVKAACVARVRQ